MHYDRDGSGEGRVEPVTRETVKRDYMVRNLLHRERKTESSPSNPERWLLLHVWLPRYLCAVMVIRALQASRRKAVAAGGLSGGGTDAALHPSQLNGLPGADDRGGAAEPRNNPGLEFAPLCVPCRRRRRRMRLPGFTCPAAFTLASRSLSSPPSVSQLCLPLIAPAASVSARHFSRDAGVCLCVLWEERRRFWGYRGIWAKWLCRGRDYGPLLLV